MEMLDELRKTKVTKSVASVLEFRRMVTGKSPSTIAGFREKRERIGTRRDLPERLALFTPLSQPAPAPFLLRTSFWLIRPVEASTWSG